MPPNETSVAPVNLEPLIVTAVPGGPLLGEKPVSTGAGTVTVKSPLPAAVPASVVTTIGPVAAAPTGTVATSRHGEQAERAEDEDDRAAHGGASAYRGQSRSKG
jgi:hypothetical protein